MKSNHVPYITCGSALPCLSIKVQRTVSLFSCPFQEGEKSDQFSAGMQHVVRGIL